MSWLQGHAFNVRTSQAIPQTHQSLGDSERQKRPRAGWRLLPSLCSCQTDRHLPRARLSHPPPSLSKSSSAVTTAKSASASSSYLPTGSSIDPEQRSVWGSRMSQSPSHLLRGVPGGRKNASSVRLRHSSGTATRVELALAAQREPPRPTDVLCFSPFPTLSAAASMLTRSRSILRMGACLGHQIAPSRFGCLISSWTPCSKAEQRSSWGSTG